MSARVLRLVLDLLEWLRQLKTCSFLYGTFEPPRMACRALLSMLDYYWSAATYQSSPASPLPNQFQ